MVVLFTEMGVRNSWGKETQEFYFEGFNLKMLFRHPSGDVDDGAKHKRLEPREKERAEDVNSEPPRH